MSRVYPDLRDTVARQVKQGPSPRQGGQASSLSLADAYRRASRRDKNRRHCAGPCRRVLLDDFAIDTADSTVTCPAGHQIPLSAPSD